MYTKVLIDDFAFPIIIWNSRDIIISANKACEKLLGYDEEDLVGRNIEELMPPEKCNSNGAISRFTKKFTQIPQLDLVTLISKVKEDVYLLVSFGQYVENEQLKYIASFKKTSRGKNDSLRVTYKEIGKNQVIEWIAQSPDLDKK